MSTKGNSELNSEYFSKGSRPEDDVWVSFIVKFSVLVETINQVYLKIIMFGFLIAMIKTTYDTNLKNKLMN
jgi:hypothetical protein